MSSPCVEPPPRHQPARLQSGEFAVRVKFLNCRIDRVVEIRAIPRERYAGLLVGRNLHCDREFRPIGYSSSFHLAAMNLCNLSCATRSCAAQARRQYVRERFRGDSSFYTSSVVSSSSASSHSVPLSKT